MKKILDLKEFFELEENKESLHIVEVSGLPFLALPSLTKYIQYITDEINKKC